MIFTILFFFSCVGICLAGNGGFIYQKSCNMHMQKMVEHALVNYPKITPESIQSIDITFGFHVQRLHDEWYVSQYQRQPVVYRPWRDATMKLSLFSLDIQASSAVITIPDGIEFIIDTSDGNFGKGPSFGFCYNNITTPAIMIPDNSLLSWPESGQNLTWHGFYHGLPQIGKLPKNNIDKGVFYGNMFDRRKQLVKGVSEEYTHIVDTRRRYAPAGQQANFMPLQSLCRHQYLIHISGLKSYSSRLKYLLLCNSTVIVLDNFKPVDSLGNDLHGNSTDGNSTDILLEYEEWYYILLKPWVHYVPARNGDELNEVMKKLRANPELAREIAENGARLAREILHPYCVQSYWSALLNEYAKRMTYRVETPAKGAVLLTNEMLLDVTDSQFQKYGEHKTSFEQWKEYIRRSIGF